MTYLPACAVLIGGLFAATGLSGPVAAQDWPPPGQTCEAPDSWFPHAQTPEPDNAGFTGGSFCAFHQWSWQTFLWLTQDDATGQPRFLSMTDPHALIDKSTPALLPRMKKSDLGETFDEFLQAGPDGILIDQQGNPVFYSQYLNDAFVSFIKENDLTNPANVQAFNPDTPFPVDSLELKLSWKIVEDYEDTSDFFTMDGQVATLVEDNGKIRAAPDKPRNVKLALVGFHIGGVVNGHPEMIWATFEHKKNAPNVIPDHMGNLTPDTVISNETGYTFYEAGVEFKDCNFNPAVTGQMELDVETQTFSPVTQVCRQYEFGNDPEDPVNNQDNIKSNDQAIASLNAGVHGKLQDLWKNYHQVGAIWFSDGTKFAPNLALDSDALLIGSFKLSNATIETFTQTQSTENNCFRCHNTLQRFPSSRGQVEMGLDPLPALELNISHAFVNIYFWSQENEKSKGANSGAQESE